jgi:hypothetical protein
MLAPNRDWRIGYLERLDHRTVRVGLDLGAYDGKPADAVRLAIDRTGLSGWTELFEGDERVFATWTPRPVPQRGIGRMELIAGPAHLVGWSAVD